MRTEPLAMVRCLKGLTLAGNDFAQFLAVSGPAGLMDVIPGRVSYRSRPYLRCFGEDPADVPC